MGQTFNAHRAVAGLLQIADKIVRNGADVPV
jgi:hypothetical protein